MIEKYTYEEYNQYRMQNNFFRWSGDPNLSADRRVESHDSVSLRHMVFLFLQSSESFWINFIDPDEKRFCK